MKIAIGTTSPPKVAAIEKVIDSSVFFSGATIQYVCEKVPSDVSDMPLSLEENMNGAKNRAQNTKKLIDDADYYIGMEGGTQIIENKAYLFGVCYIENSLGESHYGFSPLLEVPEDITKGLYENGEELGPLISQISGQEKVGNKNGAFGIWTQDQFTRKDQFHAAIICSFAPFFSKYYK